MGGLGADLTDLNAWLGLVRLLTQPKLMGEGVLGLFEASAIYQQLR